MDQTVTPEDIGRAAARLAGRVVRTPCLHSESLSAIAGCEVWLKFENLQFTASFKERGALNRLAQLTEAERARGVLAVSAGNPAQGVALHDAFHGTTHPQGTGTIAEGIAVGLPGEITARLVREQVADMLLVGEGDIEHAIVTLLEIEKTVVEGAGAAGLAAAAAVFGVLAVHLGQAALGREEDDAAAAKGSQGAG